MKREELMWFQRSRTKWLVDGDRNTRYHHLKVVNRIRKNKVVMLRNSQGHWVDDIVTLQGMVNDFYKDLFTNNNTGRTWFQKEITYPHIDDVGMEKLVMPIMDEEVRRALFSMSPWKAPGPAGFFQQSWEVVGRNICEFVREVWREPSKLGMVNKTDICLIPKINQPEFVNQFRPISLCNTIYKIVSKVIVGRLKEHIPHIVSPYQTCFVSGHSIHENIVVAQELAHSMNRMNGRTSYFVIKVDLAKTYDMLKWDFIWQTLKEFCSKD